MILKDLHATGLSHGNIKPDNILMQNGLILWDLECYKKDAIKICLIDFGHSQTFGERHNFNKDFLRHEFLGNVNFMSLNHLR